MYNVYRKHVTTIQYQVESAPLTTENNSKTPQNKTQTTQYQTLNPYKPQTHQIHSKHQQTTPKPKNNALF